jgi:hypothetical protein
MSFFPCDDLKLVKSIEFSICLELRQITSNAHFPLIREISVATNYSFVLDVHLPLVERENKYTCLLKFLNLFYGKNAFKCLHSIVVFGCFCCLLIYIHGTKLCAGPRGAPRRSQGCRKISS